MRGSALSLARFESSEPSSVSSHCCSPRAPTFAQACDSIDREAAASVRRLACVVGGGKGSRRSSSSVSNTTIIASSCIIEQPTSEA